MINTTAINTHIKYTTEELKDELEDISKSTFNYIRAIRVDDVSEEELSKRQLKLDEYKKRLKELMNMLEEKPFAGAKQYISDIKHAFEVLSK